MPTARRRLGDRGEQLVADALIRHGYVIVERNWHCRQGEIDLVAERTGELYCIEVRTRRGGAAGSPEESLSPQKRTRMETAAGIYATTHTPNPDPAWHIGFAAVQLDSAGRLERITLYPDVEGEGIALHPVETL